MAWRGKHSWAGNKGGWRVTGEAMARRCGWVAQRPRRRRWVRGGWVGGACTRTADGDDESQILHLEREAIHEAHEDDGGDDVHPLLACALCEAQDVEHSLAQTHEVERV